MNLSDIDIKTQSNMVMFVGRSGCGKTVAAASYPKNILIHDFDFRVTGALGGIKVGCYDNVDGIEVEQYDTQGIAGFEKFNKNLEKLESLRKSGIFPYKLVCIDSIGALCRVAMSFAEAASQGKGMIIQPKGGMITLRLPDPSDYRIESTIINQTFAFLRKLPCNVIVSGHTVETFRKPSDNPYGDKIRAGEKLNITDKLGESVLSYFNDVWRFDREEVNGTMKYTVEFNTDISKNSYGIGPGSYDISNVNFYKILTHLKEYPEHTPQKVKEIFKGN